MAEGDSGLGGDKKEPTLMETLEEMRKLMKPVFDEMDAEWEREGPAAMAKAESLGITIDYIGGNCPVQAEGAFDNRRFYFRARHDEWRVHVWEDERRYKDIPWDEKTWETGADYGEWPDAGWMPQHEAVGFICDSIETYRKEHDGTSSTKGC